MAWTGQSLQYIEFCLPSVMSAVNEMMDLTKDLLTRLAEKKKITLELGAVRLLVS
jgi:hypothetical protein